jgi:hypothetical protein
MVFVGIERYLHHRQRHEIQDLLQTEYGVTVSAGAISDLGRLFTHYLRTLHDACAADLRTALERDGGWPLHIDATGESGRGTLLVAFTGWRRWVLGAWKIPTERADVILPCLREVVGAFGPPCAVMRDLGRAMIPAANELVAELDRPIPVLSCHAHFLADVGKDLLDASHSALRKLFRHHKVRPGLRSLARDIGRKLGGQIATVRLDVRDWMAPRPGNHALPTDNRTGLGVVRALAQWVLDYPADATGADFPFDRPYLDLYDRCTQVRRAADAFLRTPPKDKEVHRAVLRLARLLDPVSGAPAFKQAATTLRRRATLFDELRCALRLHPAETDEHEQDPETAQRELRDIQASVDALVQSLEERRPERGPAQDTRHAIDLILAHLDRYGDSLWGHAITLPPHAGGGTRLVARTNNVLEGFYRSMKQGERRRSGRKTLADDFEHLPAEAALARNLLCPDYVEIVCGSLDRLANAFAQLDADGHDRALASEPSRRDAAQEESSQIASASLPKPDRRIVRLPSTASRIHSAASSRAPRVTA